MSSKSSSPHRGASLKDKSPSPAAAAAAAAAASYSGKATNVIERRGEHNKNLDEPFLPRANKPKVFVSEPKLFVPTFVNRTAASIAEEFKMRPQRRVPPTAVEQEQEQPQQQQQQQQVSNVPAMNGRFASANHLDMIEALSAYEILNSPHYQQSARIQNFNMYEDYIKRKQLQEPYVN